DAQRADGRQPACPGSGREARLAHRETLVGAVGVARVDEHDALEPDALDQGEDDLVVQDVLLAAADRGRRHDPPEDVLPLLARPERAVLEAADRADATGEVALEERQVVALEPAVAEPVAERGAERVREVAERLRAQERVVPPLASLRLREALA